MPVWHVLGCLKCLASLTRIEAVERKHNKEWEEDWGAKSRPKSPKSPRSPKSLSPEPPERKASPTPKAKSSRKDTRKNFCHRMRESSIYFWTYIFTVLFLQNHSYRGNFYLCFTLFPLLSACSWALWHFCVLWYFVWSLLYNEESGDGKEDQHRQVSLRLQLSLSQLL